MGILELLAEHGELGVGGLVARLGLAQPEVSNHVAVRWCGFVLTRRKHRGVPARPRRGPLSVPDVELLYVADCPGHERVRPWLRRVAAEFGTPLRERRVATAEQARAERFLGSPTVRVGGADVEPGADRRTDYGLQCRLYRTADGLADAPAETWIREALAIPGRGGQLFGDPPERLAQPGGTAPQ